MDKQLRLENIAIGYKGNTLVKDITVSLNKGNVCMLFGANGTGKTTLIRTIRNLINPVSGRVVLSGKPITNWSNHELAKRIAVVSTDRNLAPGLLVQDIISFGRIPYLKIFGVLSDEDNKIIDKYVSRLQLNELLQKPFVELSDGQQQRVMLCRALVQDTDLILLDEPTTFLDVQNRVRIFELVQQIAKEENKIILCSTHEIDLALQYADDVWVIDKHQKFIAAPGTSFSKEVIMCHLFTADLR